MRNLCIMFVCASFIGAGVMSQPVKTAHPKPASPIVVVEQPVEIEEHETAEVEEAAPRRTVHYKRQWQRTGMFGRGRWVNVPYYTYSSAKSAEEDCDPASGV